MGSFLTRGLLDQLSLNVIFNVNNVMIGLSNRGHLQKCWRFFFSKSVGELSPKTVPVSCGALQVQLILISKYIYIYLEGSM